MCKFVIVARRRWYLILEASNDFMTMTNSSVMQNCERFVSEKKRNFIEFWMCMFLVILEFTFDLWLLTSEHPNKECFVTNATIHWKFNYCWKKCVHAITSDTTYHQNWFMTIFFKKKMHLEKCTCSVFTRRMSYSYIIFMLQLPRSLLQNRPIPILFEWYTVYYRTNVIISTNLFKSFHSGSIIRPTFPEIKILTNDSIGAV